MNNTLLGGFLVPAVALVIASALPAQAFLERFPTSVTGVFPPAGWTEVDNNTGVEWIDAGGQSPWSNLTSDAAAHSYNALVVADCDDFLISPTFSLTGYTQPQLLFDRELKYSQWMGHHFASLGNGESNIDASTDGGVTWSRVWTETSTSDGYYVGEAVDLSASAANQASVELRFHYFGYDAHAWAVDEVIVDHATPTAPTLQVVGSCPGAMSLVANNLTPYGVVIFAYSTTVGSYTVAAGGCAGLTLWMAAPVQLASQWADSAGTSVYTGTAPAAACGLVNVVVVDTATCQASYAVAL